MKKCPQCKKVYGDEVSYCLNDGTALIEDSFSIPSEEEEHDTIIRHDPIIIDFPAHDETTAHYSAGVPAENIVVVSAPPATRNYAIFLILGLLIGGGLVLATLLFSKSFYQSEKNNIEVKTNANSDENIKIEKSAPPTDTPENKVVSIEPALSKHAETNDSFDGIANGRVIVTNARIRSAPDKDAQIVDTLPMNDRLDIIRRENSNSPWYQVECEHGTAGWMHGDTIEFTR